MSENLKLHSKTTLVIVSAFLSPLLGGILLAQNLSETGRRNRILYPLLFGLVFNLITSYAITNLSLNILYVYVPMNLIGGIILITIVWNENMEKGIRYRAKSPLWPFVVVVSVWSILFALNWHSAKSAGKLTSGLVSQFLGGEGGNAGVNKYNISAPDGWTKWDTVIQGVNITYVTAPKSAQAKVEGNISIISSKLGGLSFDEDCRASINTMKKYIQEFTEKEEGARTINGMPAKWVIYTGITGRGIKTEGLQYFIVNNDIIYSLTCVTLPSEMDKYQPVFEKTISSFKIN